VSELTLPELMEILHESAGADESAVGPSGADGAASEDVSFNDLGYDSLALLETVSRVERRYGLQLSDDIADTTQTPTWMLGEINAALEAETRT
jgi:act minimal PKS acyl carrier protein